MSNRIIVKKNTIYLMGVLVIISFVAFFLLGEANTVGGDSFRVATEEGIQSVALSIKDFNYYPDTLVVKEGVPVRISLDSSVTGCFRSFTVREFGVSKYLESPQEFVEFTPTKKGSYTFSCSMGMGVGRIIVE